MILISVDDHIVEPPDMFKNHLAEKYIDEAPRLVHNPDGSDTWQFRDIVIPNVALNAVAGRPKEEYGLEPQGLDDSRPGCYNVDERVKDMNAGGILGSICFPSFPGFAGRLFVTDDPDFSLALLQAYNDWHIDEWCGAYPARFIPMALPVIWDAEKCAEEVRRVAKKGVHALTFTENPAAMGYPSFHNEYWNPLWKALCDTNTVMNLHIGLSGRLAITAPDVPMDVMITLQPMNIVQAAADLLWSKPIKEYPDLKVALSEGGTGWIPYFLERANRTYEMHSTWTHQNFGGKKPSEVFREHFLTCFISDDVGVKLRNMIGIDNIAWEADYPHSDSMWPVAPISSEVFREHFLTCFISDKVGVKLRNMIGIDNIAWEADYPHSDSMWPGAPEELWDVLSLNNVPDDEITKITHENAMRWYSFDPFTHITREQATVGALRK